MYIFTTTIAKLARIGFRNMQPKDVLFEAQLPFLRKNIPFDGTEVRRGYRGYPYALITSVPANTNIRVLKTRVLDGDWGDFEVRDMELSCHGSRPGDRITFAVMVDVKGQSGGNVVE